MIAQLLVRRDWWMYVCAYLSGCLVKLLGAGDGFLECTLSHHSYFAVEQREEVGEAKGLHPSLSGAAPAQRERESVCV